MTSSTDDLSRRISPTLRTREPISVRESDIAGVAVLLGPWGEAKILLMKRAERPGDPWSGQVAFPGGRVEPDDKRMKDTAVRETREEMGIHLEKDSTFLGYMGLFRARTRGMRVVPSVFRLSKRPRISTNAEVDSHRWVPLAEFVRDRSRSLHMVEYGGMRLTFPAFKVDDYLVWGLTERIISNLTEFL